MMLEVCTKNSFQIYEAFHKLLFGNLFSIFSDGDLAPNHCCGLWGEILSGLLHYSIYIQ